MAIPYWKKSAQTTPLIPPNAAYITTTIDAPMTTTQGSKPSMTPPIFIAAKVTEPMIRQLKKIPK